MTIIRAMTVADLQGVVEIERLSFTLPWSENAFRHELLENEQAHFFVAEQDGQVIGAAGYWFIVDECHVSTIATHPDWRRQGVGEMLLRAMLSHALALEALMAVLEVRASNEAAIKLYRKYGFDVNRVRKGYYRDNLEDALEMIAQPIKVL
jgi:[ribosomal protein S18]-alanine N-acetyltransferase